MVHWITKPLPHLRHAVFFRFRFRLRASLQNTSASPTPILSLNLVQRPGRVKNLDQSHEDETSTYRRRQVEDFAAGHCQYPMKEISEHRCRKRTRTFRFSPPHQLKDLDRPRQNLLGPFVIHRLFKRRSVGERNIWLIEDRFGRHQRLRIGQIRFDEKNKANPNNEFSSFVREPFH